MKFNELSDGIYAAALTPMHSNFSCDHKKLFSHCTDLIERGCRGIALFGTTGEGPSFSLHERTETLARLISQGLDPSKIILANGSSGIQDTIDLGREAVKQRCAAFLVAPPSFYKNVTDLGVLAYYRTIIEKIGSPNLRLLLYHIPQFSGVPISLEIIATLQKEYPKIVIGIKESEGNIAFTKSILKAFPKFKVFVGNERQITESALLGGAGAICGIANLYPEWLCSQVSETNLDLLFKALEGLPFIPAAKALMEKREGKIWHTIRPPLISLRFDQKELFLSKTEVLNKN